MSYFWYMLFPLEFWGFVLAEELSLHPTGLRPSFSVVTRAESDTNLPSLALANSPTFKWKQYIFLLILPLVFCSFIEENALIDKLTIITTTSPVPSNPSIAMIQQCLESYLKLPALRGCKQIIVFDGVPFPQSYRTLAYELFIRNVQKMIKDNPAFANTRLVINRQHKHLANSLREAIKIVDTPYVLVHQHDFALSRPFDAVGLIQSMDRNPNLKMVRFNKWSNVANSWDGEVDNYIEGGALVPLTRTFGWSDNDHIARLDYYIDFVLPKVTWNGAMEWFVHNKEKCKQNHLEFGTYIYGAPGELPYLKHLDGKTFKSK